MRHDEDLIGTIMIISLVVTLVIFAVIVAIAYAATKNEALPKVDPSKVVRPEAVKARPLVAVAGLFGLTVGVGCMAFGMAAMQMRHLFGPMTQLLSWLYLGIGVLALPGGFAGLFVGVKAMFTSRRS